ncbi:MAG: hypothetical protein IH866_03900 [Chloroflexi bacterium]|nr:hypothetical protein [Chloroflexota bacterium]
MTSLRIRIVTLSLALAGLALLAACSGGDDAGEPTSSPPTPTTQSATATEAPRLATEWGEEPIYWRTTTEDGIESLQACVDPCIGEKVIFRISNGYAEQILLVVAERESDGLRVEFEAGLAVAEDELPGSFYPLNLALPEPGAWRLTIMAGVDETIILVDVAPAEG